MEEIVIQINGGIMVKTSCKKTVKKRHVFGKEYVQNPAKCNCKNGKFLASIIWMIQQFCVIKLQSHMSKKQILMIKEQPVKDKFIYFPCIFINYHSIIIAVNICCCLIKH